MKHYFFMSPDGAAMPDGASEAFVSDFFISSDLAAAALCAFLFLALCDFFLVAWSAAGAAVEGVVAPGVVVA